MFEELGYEYFNNGLRITYEKCPDNECKMIEFNLKKKTILLADDSSDVVEIDLKEQQAINQQIKELNWNDQNMERHKMVVR